MAEPFDIDGIDQTQIGALVPLKGKLPYQLEFQTSKLLDLILYLYSAPVTNRAVLRKKLNRLLYSKTRPGFYHAMNKNLHLAYADQRGGHGTQHWWRLFFDDVYREQIEKATRGTAITVSTSNSNSQARPEGNVQEWGGMYFRSQAEINIAEVLDQKGVLFFANCRGRISSEKSPVSDSSGLLTGRLEVDFLVFYKGNCMVLEVDGQHHQEGSQTIRDYIRDRILLREEIPTVRFTGLECLNQPTQVVTEFLNIFKEYSATIN